MMKSIILLLSLLFNSVALASLNELKDGLLINSDTGQPYTGQVTLINKDWGAVERSKHYVDGLLHGQEKSFYRSGKLRSVSSFKQGLLDGTTKVYYQNGVLRILIQAKKGIKEGRAINYHANGRVRIERFYKNDVIHGQERTWFGNGNPKTSKHYRHGVLVGQALSYYDNGRLFERIRIRDGSPLYKQLYKIDGTRHY